LFERVEDPMPADEGTDSVGIGVPRGEDGVDPCAFGVEVGIDLPFDLGPDRLEQALGGG
jgi:hypothetical protein